MNMHDPLKNITQSAFAAGDIFPDLHLCDLAGKQVSLYGDAIEGRPLVLLICPRFSESNIAALEQFATKAQTFTGSGASILAIFPNEKSARRHSSLPFPVLVDRQHRSSEFGRELTTVVLRNNNHIKGIATGETAQQVSRALAWVADVKREMPTIHMEQRHP